MNKIISLIVFAVLLLAPVGTQSVFAGEQSCDEGDTVWTDPSNNHVTISPLRNCSDISFDTPIFYFGDDLTITYDGDWYCSNEGLGSAVSVELLDTSFSDGVAFGGGGEPASIEEVAPPGFLQILQPAYAAVTIFPAFMDDSDNDGIYEIVVNLFDQHGSGDLSFSVRCTDGGPFVVPGPTIFLDPSGQVFDKCNNQPIQDAIVTLFDNIGNPGTEATQQSAPLTNVPGLGFVPIMDPQENPQMTLGDGSYGWLVLPSPDSNDDGFDDIDPILWKVQASAPGYISQTAPPGNGFPIPPEVVGLDFSLQPVDGCPAVIGGELLSIDSTSLIIAGIQSSAMWILPIAFAGAGFAAFKLRKYWN